MFFLATERYIPLAVDDLLIVSPAQRAVVTYAGDETGEASINVSPDGAAATFNLTTPGQNGAIEVTETIPPIEKNQPPTNMKRKLKVVRV